MANIKKYAVLGEKLSHTLSPFIHKKIYECINADCGYGVLEVEPDKLINIKNILKEGNYSGINVTIPYKEKIMPMLSYLSPEAVKIGAVNTVSISDGILSGYNTDYYGFGAMLSRHGINLRGMKAVVFGSGGAAKAVTAYLLDNGIRSVTVAGRNGMSLSLLKGNFPEITVCSLFDTDKLKGDIAINCTPAGMYPNADSAVINKSIAASFKIMADLVYNPYKTKFLAMGEALGLKTLNGLYMLIEQAVKADEIFLNLSIDPAVGEKIYQELVKQ